MKNALLLLAPLLLSQAAAQVVPTTPTKFKTRSLGASGSLNGSSTATTGASVARPPSVIRTTTYLALSPARQWTSTDGKPLLAKVIAMEDLVSERLSTDPAPASAPQLQGKPTVTRDGQVRLLSGTQPYLIPLERLSQADRDFIAKLAQAVATSPVPSTSAKP